MSGTRKLAAILAADFLGHCRFPDLPTPTGTAPLRKERSFAGLRVSREATAVGRSWRLGAFSAGETPTQAL
jgi:hypothetical protein